MTTILDRTGPVPITNELGSFTLHGFVISDSRGVEPHLALTLGSFEGVVPVRINSACITSEVFHDDRCDCAWQLDEAIRRIVEAGTGIVTYHPGQEGRGSGLMQKLRSYQYMAQGMTTGEAFERLGEPPDSRDYDAAIEILRDFSVASVRLFTNNPAKRSALEAAGITVAAIDPIVAPAPGLRSYLASKAVAFGHWLEPAPAPSTECEG
jgi:GTP cyclohydrolase II